MFLHKVGATRRIGALVSNCFVYVAVCICVVIGVCMMGCVSCIGVVGFVDGIDGICECDSVEMVEVDYYNSFTSDS